MTASVTLPAMWFVAALASMLTDQDPAYTVGAVIMVSVSQIAIRLDRMDRHG